VHFAVEHDFPASSADVAAVLCDPEFHTQLDLPDLSRPEVLVSSADGAARLLRLRYEYIGELDPIARTVVGTRKISWIQELRLDTGTFRGSLTFEAEADAKRLNGKAEVVLVESAGRSQRRIAGDFHVRVPLVGGTAERKIVPGLVRRLDVEAAALAAVLAERA
jgi:hypothetical protein